MNLSNYLRAKEIREDIERVERELYNLNQSERIIIEINYEFKAIQTEMNERKKIIAGNFYDTILSIRKEFLQNSLNKLNKEFDSL